MAYLIITFGVLNILVILDVANRVFDRIKLLEKRLEIIEKDLEGVKYESNFK